MCGMFMAHLSSPHGCDDGAAVLCLVGTQPFFPAMTSFTCLLHFGWGFPCLFLFHLPTTDTSSLHLSVCPSFQSGRALGSVAGFSWPFFSELLRPDVQGLGVCNQALWPRSLAEGPGASGSKEVPASDSGHPEKGALQDTEVCRGHCAYQAVSLSSSCYCTTSWWCQCKGRFMPSRSQRSSHRKRQRYSHRNVCWSRSTYNLRKECRGRSVWGIWGKGKTLQGEGGIWAPTSLKDLSAPPSSSAFPLPPGLTSLHSG